MIEVKHLSKTYKDKEVETKALKNVSFTLPDTGLVFIVGKSGSGKSTLINMLGGLDDITKGHVIIDGFDLSKVRTHYLDKFRNSYLGIVYQNYNLFNDESVFDNIRSAVDVIERKVPTEEIEQIIKTVELEDKRDALVKNLSGGQKQRVAIARALIKNPKLILADEPTGNLDTRTAKAIFEYLKEASKDRLVVVITHDMPSALEYADRILEIADGEIVKDVQRKGKEHETHEFIELADNQKIDKEEMKALNEELKSFDYQATLKEDRFSETKEVKTNREQTYKPKRQKYRRVLINSLRTLNRNKISTIITVLICMTVVGLMAISAALTKFDSRAAISDVIDLYNIKNLAIRKSYSETNTPSKLEKDRLLKISKEEENKLEELGYVGKKYPIYTFDTTIAQHCYSIHGTGCIRYENFFAEAVNGVVKCDEEYLTRTFGEIEVLAGSLYTAKTTGKVIVTDFIADSFLYVNDGLKSPDENDPYQKIVNTSLSGRNSIGAVIKTNYKEKYKVFLETIERIKKEPQHASQLRKELVKSDLFTQFLNDANAYLNYGYSLNPNYENCVYQNYSHVNLYDCDYSLTENGKKLEIEPNDSFLSQYEGLEGEEAEMSLGWYNKIFEKNLTDVDDPSFEEKDFYIIKYNTEKPKRDEEMKTIHVKIKKLYVPISEYDGLHISEELRKTIMDWDIYQYGWVFENVEQCYDLYQKLYPMYFYNYVTCFQAVYDTIGIISVFADIFSIVLYALIGILVLIITMHNLRIIKHETYQFGVLKSMGYSSLYLAITLLVIDVISIIAIFGVSTLFSWAAGIGANRLIQLGFVEFAKSTVYNHITMISFSFMHVLYFNAIVLGLMTLTSFIPFLAIKRIKPSRIIRNSE